ncbi:MAG: hypothetical protein U5R06_23245 [candidate division KSB1 bacterium]|nr:hypothetical protein [candidate division KSB1 bacterium]
MSSLSQKELIQLIQSVFPKLDGDRQLALLVDVPNQSADDTDLWKTRRSFAESWAAQLKEAQSELDLEVRLVGYASVDSNNADLPLEFYPVDSLPDVSSNFGKDSIPAADFFSSTQIIMAPTQYSATAPLKVAASRYGFRAATMPGFSEAMIPALRIDYERVNRRCQLLRKKLNDAEEAKVEFESDGETVVVHFDLRHRHAHASSGRFPDPGTAGNLPSGETYIVPYEGELDIPSETHGVLPVQFDDEVVLFRVKDNKATEVLVTDHRAANSRIIWTTNPPIAIWRNWDSDFFPISDSDPSAPCCWMKNWAFMWHSDAAIISAVLSDPRILHHRQLWFISTVSIFRKPSPLSG